MRYQAPILCLITFLLLLVPANAQENSGTNSISLESCSIMVPGSIDKYSVDEVVSVFGTKQITLSCTLSSSLDESKGIILSFEKSDGAAIDQITYLVMPAGHSEEFSFNVPVDQSPKKHNAKVFVTDESNQTISNSVSFSYDIVANKGKIKNLDLDKKIYKKGDVAKATVVWDFDEVLNRIGTFSLQFDIKDGANNICSEKENFEVSLYITEKELELPIVSDCKNPTATVALLQGDKILDTQVFSFESPQEKQDGPIDEPGTDGSLDSIPIIVAILILIILAVVLYIKKFKK